MQTIIMKRAGWATTALLALLVGCNKSTEVVTPVTQECQLQTELIVRNGISEQATTHTYNANGQRTKSVSSFTNGTTITYTYTYDAAGNVITALTQGVATRIKIDNTAAYEYADGRLTKITSKASGDLPGTTVDSYSYDGSGRIATHTYTSSDPQYGTESYAFTNGVLTGGAITRSGQSLTVTVDNGRIAGVVSPDGGRSRYIYDANGYATRSESLDKAGILQFYTVYEYSTTAYKTAVSPYSVVTTINLYGSTDLPYSRVAIYNADGSLKAETRYQYQINSRGYIASLGYVQNIPGVGGQGTSQTTYTYSNCQ